MLQRQACGHSGVHASCQTYAGASAPLRGTRPECVAAEPPSWLPSGTYCLLQVSKSKIQDTRR